MIHWTKVQFEDDLPLEQRTELLREYKETGSIQDYFFAPLPGQSTEPAAAWNVNAAKKRAFERFSEINFSDRRN